MLGFSFPFHQIFISRVVGMNSDRSVSEHRLRPGGCNFYEFVCCSVDRVFEVSDDSELHLLLISRDFQKSTTREFFIVDL